ncbi:ABC-three component system protein [Burkholderia sp. S171]|uniref:ABC-three component system protein n=1 Tax=Burkholderia sp. S171 TaxID=1641860 RepID=UPI00131C3F45|nr:ABC-three component system protein [Burkholderia sp. S171]
MAKKEANPRPTISRALEVALCTQVSEACPNCGKPLFKKKGKTTFREYEIAHIYPLNPTDDELELLQSQKKLSEDANHEDNLIPLCFTCHNIFDNPKTIEGYCDLVRKKENLIKQSEQIEIFGQYQLESEIIDVINSLIDSNVQFDESTEFEAKDIDAKLNSSIRPITKRKIKNDVSSFYLFVRDRFADLERNDPTKAVLIALQVKTFYVKQTTVTSSQQEIFENTVDWIRLKHELASKEAAEVIAAFYVQNCELFE